MAKRLEISTRYIQERMWKSSGPELVEERHKRFYFALALNCLTEEEPLLDVCRRYGLNRGDLQKLQKDCARHAGMMSLFCRKLGWFSIATLIKPFHDRIWNRTIFQNLFWKCFPENHRFKIPILKFQHFFHKSLQLMNGKQTEIIQVAEDCSTYTEY